MSKAEHVALIMVKLIEARDATRQLLGDYYEADVELAQKLIRARMEKDEYSDIEAAMAIMRETDEPSVHGLMASALLEMQEDECSTAS